jgi:hypothetical protein
MLRCLVLSASLMLAATGLAEAQSCDINADQAAVVAAWGSKLRDGSISATDSEAISKKIQEIPALAQSDPEAACAALAELKVQLGLMPAQ